jgi:hypothetical protein
MATRFRNRRAGEVPASREVRDIIASWFTSVASGDAAWISRHVDSDPAEWLSGDDAAAYLVIEAEAMGGMVTIQPGDLDAYEEGSVGWGVARPALNFPNGISIPIRWSGAFRQEDGGWTLVQAHASIDLSNDAALSDGTVG